VSRPIVLSPLSFHFGASSLRETISMIAKTTKVMLFGGHFVPHFRAGGPVRSKLALVESLGDEFDFRVVSPDTDLGETTRNPQLLEGWSKVGKATVLYVPLKSLTLRRVRRLVLDVRPDVLYLDSLFARSTLRALALDRLGLLGSCSSLVAPRGELLPGALSLKSKRKKIALKILYPRLISKRIRFHSTSAAESEAIARLLPRRSILLAPNLPPVSAAAGDSKRPQKTVGRLDCVLIGRISPMKNPVFAIECVKEARRLGRDVRLTLIGPFEDKAVLRMCRRTVDENGLGNAVHLVGEKPHEEIAGALSEGTAFFLPTLGENFGYVVLEALLAGLPALISTRTPWKEDDANGALRTCELERDKFVEVLMEWADLTDEQWLGLSRSAKEAGETYRDDPLLLDQSRRLFTT
jgi:glycosyltransferase involved in cell wall biosynthesis